MHQSERKSERRLKPHDSVRRVSEYFRPITLQMRGRTTRTEQTAELIHLLRLRIVRRVISCDHVDRTVANCRVQRLDIVAIAQRRVHLGIRPPGHRGVFIQREMMRRDFAGDVRAMPPRGADKLERLSRGYM